MQMSLASSALASIDRCCSLHAVSVIHHELCRGSLGLTRVNLTDAGIAVATSKTGKRLLIEWSEALRSTVKRALAQAPQVRQPIICNKQGKAYTVDGFNTIFYRAMGKVVKDEKSGLTERLQFRDLRAKSASDDTAEAASTRLGHADSKNH